MFIAPQRTRLWGHRAQLLVGRGRRKWKIQDAKFNQVLKGLDFLHPLTSQLQFFSSISHNCLFNCPFWINIIFLMFSASSWSVVYTFKDSCLRFPPLPQWWELCLLFCLSLMLPLQRIWRVEGKDFCVCGAWGLVRELILAPSEPPDPHFLLFSHCSLNPRQVRNLWSWVFRWKRAQISSLGKPGWILGFPGLHMLLTQHTRISFEITGIAHLLISASSFWVPWSQRSSEHSSSIEQLIRCQITPQQVFSKYLFGS